MKKGVYFSMLAMVLNGAIYAAEIDFSVGAKPWENFSKELRVINLLSFEDVLFTELMRGEHPEIAVEFSAGTILPIHFFLKGDLVNLIDHETRSGRIEILQKFYARYIEGELIFSHNLVDWKPFFEFMTGTATAILSIQNGEPSLTFGAETNRRV